MTTKFLRPLPRGTVTPSYWGNPAAFGGTRKPRWEFHKPALCKIRRERRKAVLESL